MKMRITKRLYMTTAVLLVMGASTHMAKADCCDATIVSAVGAANSAITASETTIAADVNAANLAVVSALQLLSGQNSLNNQGVITAQSNIASLEDTRRVMGMQQQATFNAINQAGSGSSGCNMITGAVGAQTLENMVSQYREQANQSDLDYYAGNSTLSASHNGRQAAIGGFISQFCLTQSTQADKDSGLCPNVTFNAPSEAQPGGAGTTASGVPDAVNADIFLNPTDGVMSPAQQSSANMYLALAGPTPVGPLANNSASTLSGKDLAYSRLQQEAQFSPASDVISNLIARTTPNASVGSSTVQSAGTSSTSGNTVSAPQELQSWAEGTAANTLGYAPTGGKYFPYGVSEDAYLELRAKSWAMGVNFLGNLHSEGEPQVMKDLVTIEAFRAEQGWEEYHQQEQTNALLASILNTLKSEHTGG
jgi:hypothetical protein